MGHYASEMGSSHPQQELFRVRWFRVYDRLKLMLLGEFTVEELTALMYLSGFKREICSPFSHFGVEDALRLLEKKLEEMDEKSMEARMD